MLLGIGFVNRNLVFEQRASANQYRSTQAFEAAEAGLEWALAQLNNNQRVDADCLPITGGGAGAGVGGGATSFRERYLNYVPSSATFEPASWIDAAGIAMQLRPTCVRTIDGWSCSCPVGSEPGLAQPEGAAPAPAFTLQFQSAGQPGLVRVVAVGCTSLGGPCASASSVPTDAAAQVQVLFGLLPALRTPPAAALTVRGSVHADLAAFGAHNRDAASGGLAIHAGGTIDASHAHLTGPAGASTATATAANDTALVHLSPAQFFASYFGIDKGGWTHQPVVRRLRCSGDCTAALLSAIASDGAASLIHVSGDLRITGPATLGSAEQPVVIVASGSAQLEGAVGVNGLIYADTVTWSHTAGPGAAVHGALLSEGDYQGDGVPEIVYDADVLARLKGNAGTFTRVNGSWRDF